MINRDHHRCRPGRCLWAPRAWLGCGWWRGRTHWWGELPGIRHARWGVNVTCGDIDGDGIDEILTVPGPHPNNPARLKSWNYDGETLTQIDRMSFMVFEEGPYVAGARLAFGDFYQAPPFLP